MVKIDPRTRQDMINAMKERAKSYTPEWHLEPEEPDIAAALGLVYAEMLEGTVKKINGLPLKNKVAFYNMLNASLLPGSPSEGFVSFGLSSDDAADAEVPAGTAVSCYGGDDEPVHFETLDDVLVTSATITKSFCVDDDSDHIGEYGDILHSDTPLFSLPEPNLQSHVLYVSHPHAFNLHSKSQLSLSFFHRGSVPLREKDIRTFADSRYVSAEYYTKDKGFVPFDSVRESGGRLILEKNGNTGPIIPDEDGYQLRFTAKDMTGLQNFDFVYAQASPRATEVLPDSITDGDTELDRNGFFPFGERFRLFDEIYFGCGEVLDKRGASVTMNFDVSFLKIPLENQLPDDEIKWKWIAKKSDFKERTSYLLSISEVIWEYYNGYGWSRLFPDSSYSDLFNFRDGVTNTFRSITFVCPEDMTKVFVGAQEDCYIRARVLKAENLYKLKGFYMSPFIRNLSFDYHYEKSGCRLDAMKAINCLEQNEYDPRSEDSFVPFRTVGDSRRTVYLGYSSPPERSPLRSLWDIDEDPLALPNRISWQYLTSGGWKSMNIADETNGLTTVGMIIYLDNHGFIKKKLFGEELYWIRLVDTENRFRNGTAAFPVIRGISENSVRARNVDSHREEFFAMNVYTENASFGLSSENVLDIDLYVNELHTITEAETERLAKEGRIIRTTDDTGIVTEVWVRWKEVSTFIDEDSSSRCYIADRSAGTVTFGNGRKGRIPSASETDNIHVIYTTGGGERSNAPKGTISTMERSIGLISSVTNPKNFYGGCDTENVYKALERNAVMFRTQGKVVTAHDLKELALCASRSIRGVRVYSGMNMAGENENGAVTLVVLKASGSRFSHVRSRLREYLLPRIVGSVAAADSLYITEPTFVVMNIKTELAAASIDGIFNLKRRVTECIRKCIDSYNGNDGSDEWLPGRLPNEHQIRSALLRLEQITYIKNIHITTCLSGPGGLTEIDSDRLKRLPYALPVCGETDISIIQA